MNRKTTLVLLALGSALVAGPSPARADFHQLARAFLEDARRDTGAVRDLASNAVTLHPETDPAGADRVIQHFGGLAYQAGQSLAQGRQALASGLRAGTIQGAAAAQFRTRFEECERDLLAATKDFEDNLKIHWPLPPRPAPLPKPPESSEADDDLGFDLLHSDDVAAFLRELKRLRTLAADAHRGADERLGFRKSTATLDQAFQAGGVDWARRYAESWGPGLYVDLWGPASRRGAWLPVLDSVIALLESGRRLEVDYLVLLRRAMRRFAIEDSEMTRACDQVVATMVQRGRFMDESRRQWERHMATYTTDAAAAAAAARSKQAADQGAAQAVATWSALVVRIRTSLWLDPPPTYTAWLEKHPQPAAAPTAPPPAPRTESQRFHEEVLRLFKRMEARLEGAESLLWNHDVVADVAESFDSYYFSRLWRYFDFDGTRMIGGEVNYYFQGMFWGRVGLSKFWMNQVINAHNLRKGRRLGNRNQYAAAAAGWNDMTRAMRQPQGPLAYFQGDAFEHREVRDVGPNPDHHIPGLEPE